MLPVLDAHAVLEQRRGPHDSNWQGTPTGRKDPEPRGEARGGKPACTQEVGWLTQERARAAAEGAEPRQGTRGMGSARVLEGWVRAG